MAAPAAKYGHCHVRYPVEYRSKVPFRPEVTAPLDFAARVAEIFALDRELDRAVLGLEQYATLLSESAEAYLTRGELHAEPRAGASPHSAGAASPWAGGAARRQFLLNELQFLRESHRYRPPWSVPLVQEAHARLTRGLGPHARPGEFREVPLLLRSPSGEPIYRAAPPEKIRGELDELLDWVDRFGPTLNPVVPATVLLQGFNSIQPFADGNASVGRVMARLYLHLAGLSNAELVPFVEARPAEAPLRQRLALWTESTNSYLELIDYSTDAMLQAYQLAAHRWLAPSAGGDEMEETALRLLGRARRHPNWFSAHEASGWVGGRSTSTVIRHLNDLVGDGLLESMGKTRAKRYRALGFSTALPGLVERFTVHRLPPPGRPRARAALGIAPAAAGTGRRGTYS
ncbi:MAG TPA: Fic family protein [Thermoplasmata archaeon]|nr:Fic family protein [Thermoplasmata archaeon]